MCLSGCKTSFQCDLCAFQKHKIKRCLNRRLGVEGSRFNVVKCLKCGLLSLYPVPNEFELRSIYSDYAVKKDRVSVEKIRLNIYVQKLTKLKSMATGEKLLDIGAGVGTFVNCARRFGFDPIGVEYESGQCKLAKELYGIDLINNRFEAICADLAEDPFDVIHMHHVLEHVQSPKRVLKLAYGLLRKGGILLVEVPNQFSNIRTELRYHIFKQFSLPDNSLHHLYFFSIRTLVKYLKSANFAIIELNQFRPREKEMAFWEKLPKDLFRYLTSKWNIGGGNFIEVFCKRY